MRYWRRILKLLGCFGSLREKKKSCQLMMKNVRFYIYRNQMLVTLIPLSRWAASALDAHFCSAFDFYPVFFFILLYLIIWKTSARLLRVEALKKVSEKKRERDGEKKVYIECGEPPTIQRHDTKVNSQTYVRVNKEFN